MLSRTLIVCLLPVPAAASPGQIAGAIPREAARLVANQDADPSDPDAEQRDTLTLAGWSRVRRLTPGAKMIVTVKGEQPRRWRFGTADDSQLTVHDSTGHEETIARSNVAEIETFAIRVQGWSDWRRRGRGFVRCRLRLEASVHRTLSAFVCLKPAARG
jgi:hypothetical protein